MKDFRVTLAQIAPTLGNVEANLALHLDAVSAAAREGADVVAFPELSLTGYLLRDQVSEVAVRRSDPIIDRLEKASRTVDLAVGLVEEGVDHRYYNAAAYFSRGRLIQIHRKLYLPNYGMFQEGRDFAAGDSLRTFAAPHGTSGMLVCEDHWHATCPWLLAQQGAEAIFTLSSSPSRGARPEIEVTSVRVWENLLKVSAQFQTAFMIYVNRVGCEDGLVFGGGSLVVDPFGRIVAHLPPVDEGVLTVELSQEVLRRARTAYPLLRDERLDLVRRETNRLCRIRFALDPEDADETAEAASPSETTPDGRGS